MQNRQVWKMMVSIKEAILENHGMIFGGFVRDMILHDHNALEFYHAIDNAPLSYHNVSVHPESKDRLIIPHDIDCVIDARNFMYLKQALKAKHFMWKTVRVMDPESYIDGFTVIHGNSVQLHKVYLKLDASKVFDEVRALPCDMSHLQKVIKSCISKQPVVYIDVFVSDQVVPHPFFGKLNFECNGLYLTQHGLSLCPDLCCSRNPLQNHRIMNKVINDIIKKKAVFHGFNFAASPKKLLQRDWTICDAWFTSVRDSSYEGHCIICHDKLPEQHFKLTCCDARYHATCLHNCVQAQIQTKGHMSECILCKAISRMSTQHLALLWDIDTNHGTKTSSSNSIPT